MTFRRAVLERARFRSGSPVEGRRRCVQARDCLRVRVQLVGYYGPAGDARHITFRYQRL